MTERQTEAFEEGLLTVGEACAFLRVGRTKLYGLLGVGALPSTLIGSPRTASTNRVNG